MSDLTNGDTFFSEGFAPDPPASAPSGGSSRRLLAQTLFEYVELIVITVSILLFVSLFLFRHTVVDGTSMVPTLQHSEHLIITDLFYEPRVDDVIVFESAEQTGLSTPLIKRVIATAGQTVRIDGRGVFVDGRLIESDPRYLEKNDELYEQMYTVSVMRPSIDENGRYYLYEVGEGEVFVMGDNRFNSLDSRVFGAVSSDCILGRAVLRILPLSSFGGID